jgi:hypothetical protein
MWLLVWLFCLLTHIFLVLLAFLFIFLEDWFPLPACSAKHAATALSSDVWPSQRSCMLIQRIRFLRLEDCVLLLASQLQRYPTLCWTPNSVHWVIQTVTKHRLEPLLYKSNDEVVFGRRIYDVAWCRLKFVKSAFNDFCLCSRLRDNTMWTVPLQF